jgi:uncharacterized repeat protein (TIGR03803 family)
VQRRGSSFAGLIADGKGNLYGTTNYGGTLNSGTAFEVTPEGGEIVLYSFCSMPNCSDGAYPQAPPIADSAGNLYGATVDSGACTSPPCPLEGGTVFKVTPAPTPFSFFSSRLVIAPHNDYFELLSNITLGSGAAYLDPPTQTLIAEVGTFTATVPPGSFVKASTSGEWDFDGPIIGVNIHARIWLTGTKQYLVLIRPTTALTGAKNSMPVTLSLGTNSGTAPVTAAIYN